MFRRQRLKMNFQFKPYRLFLCTIQFVITASIVSTIYCSLIQSVVIPMAGANEEAAVVEKEEEPTSTSDNDNDNNKSEGLAITLTQMYSDDHVAGYIPDNIPREKIVWVFEFASKVWAYAKKTYGPYGPDPQIYITIIVGSDPFLKESFMARSRFDTDDGLNNEVLFVIQGDMSWVEKVNKREELFATLTSCIGAIVETSSNDIRGTPGFTNGYNDTDRSSAWNFIFVYDVFLKLGMTQEAASFYAADPSTTTASQIESLDEDDRANWIRNWYWPIYFKYNSVENNVLNEFLTNCYLYFPKLPQQVNNFVAYFKYNDTMKKGEFVHFWSGSVGVDLRDLADFAFSWDSEDEKIFQKARVSYPKLQYRCNNSCDEFSFLESAVVPDDGNKIPLRNRTNDRSKPEITIISEYKPRREMIRKRVKTTLYRPHNTSAEQYLYDGRNELHILKIEWRLCYYITCSAPYIIKWATNIPIRRVPFNVGEDVIDNCGIQKYLNSRRLQDPTHKSEDSPSHGNGHAGMNQEQQQSTPPKYTIQFIYSQSGFNMGLLKCESIENSNVSTDLYLTDGNGFPGYGNKLVNMYDNSDKIQNAKYIPLTFTKVNVSSFLSNLTDPWIIIKRHPNITDVFTELFLNNPLDKELIVPCRGTTLTTKPDLKWTIWSNKENGNLLLESSSVSVKYNVTYDPVIGFTLTFPIWPFEVYKNFLFFTCEASDTKSEMTYKVQVTSQDTEHPASKITIVDEESQISSESKRRCFFVKNSDVFLFIGGISRNSDNLLNGRYPLKIISCNSPHECDVFRQCLDFNIPFCFAGQVQIQAEIFQLVNPHNRGLLRCFDYHETNKAKPIYEYTFVGLDRIRYVLSEDIPTKAIIHVDETPQTLFTNVPATFRCQISTFNLVANIRFGLVFLNKTRILLDSHNHGHKPLRTPLPFLSSKFDLYDNNDMRSVMNANADLGIGWENIQLNLTSDVVGVTCFAPLHNSTKWVNVTRSFVAKDIQKPKIQKDGESSRRVFGKDEKDFNLHCDSSGAPDPEIKWILPNPNSALGNYLESENPLLKFPPMEKSFAGKYTCVASNPYGNDSYDFLLEYQESGLGWRENTGIVFGVIFLIGILTSFVLLLLKYRNTSRKLRDLTEEEMKEFTHGKKDVNNGGYKYSQLNDEGRIDISLLPFDKKFILNPKDLMIENGVVLGKGNFGIVYRGLLKGCPVAVKTLKSTADISFVKSLLGELKIMSFIGDHDHIVHFFGAVIEKIQKRAVEAVVELSPFGNLKNYLRSILASISSAESRFSNLLVNDAIVFPDTTKATTSSLTNTTAHARQDGITTLTLVDWCRQIASGMNFLALKRVYHGDLAARNVLVFENNILKITDFGMSKQLYLAASYTKKEKIALPWRWMAIETLNFQEFSIESDVWAFGVTIWEIFSLGKFPFPGLNWSPEFMNILSSGMRMGKPEYCSHSVYDQMLKCWSERPMDRPNFEQLVSFFINLSGKTRVPSSSQQVEDEDGENKASSVVYSSLQ